MIKRLEQFLATPKAQGLGLTTKSELLRHAVNEFLDEQEDFYNKIQSIKDFILMMMDRDHIVLTYNTESELAEILSALIDGGIKNNQVIALFISKNEEPKYFEVLKKCDINVDKMLNSQDLMTILTDEYLQNKPFSFDPFKKDFDFLVDLTKKRGKNGLCYLATVAPNLVEQNRYDEAVHLEQKVDEYLEKSDIPITAICLYKFLPKKIEDALGKSHHVIIKRTVTATGLQ